MTTAKTNKFTAHVSDSNTVEIYHADGTYSCSGTWSGREICEYEADLDESDVAELEAAIRAAKQ